jgi:superfamily II DNA helicase RecQ
MKCSLSSANDLLRVFGPKEDLENQKIPPTFIYSGTRNATLKVMKVVNQARRTPGCEYNPRSPFIRRYHAGTGDKEKLECVEEFTTGKFPCMLCTMALGLGQNWKRVRRVISMGRGDPSTICQMMGRAGRDGRTGLAILMMEPHHKFGKDKVEDFNGDDDQEDDCRMDALAVTPICLRIAFSVDNM